MNIIVLPQVHTMHLMSIVVSHFNGSISKWGAKAGAVFKAGALPAEMNIIVVAQVHTTHVMSIAVVVSHFNWLQDDVKVGGCSRGCLLK